MRIAVIGSRGIIYIDFDKIGACPGDTIVSGGAKGVDTIAACEARKRGLAVEVHRPDYSKYGRAATHIRNREIVAASDRVVAFWDGQSRGTLETVKVARRYGKDVQIVGG